MQYQVNRLKLDNGAEGLIIDIPNAVSVYSLLSFAGGYDAVADYLHKYQTPHILEHVSFYTTDYPQSIMSELQRRGAITNALTSDRGIGYVAQTPTYDFARVLDLNAQIFEHPAATPELVELEKKNITSELKARLESGKYWLQRALVPYIGHHTLLAADAIATLGNITFEDVQEYRAQSFTTDNLRFIVAGDFNGDLTVVDRLRQLDLPRGKRFKYNLPTVEDGTKYCFEARPHVKIITAGLGFALRRSLTVRDTLIRNALFRLLFGDHSSCVASTARDKGWASHIDSFALERYDGVTLPLGIVFKSSADNLTNMIQLISQTLKELGRGELPELEAELERIKYKMIGNKLMAYETPRAVVDAMCGRYFATGEAVDLNAAPEIIKSITLGDIQQLARELTSSPLRMVGLFGDITEADAAAAAATLDAALK